MKKNQNSFVHRSWLFFLLHPSSLILLLALPGCQILGIAANALPQYTKAAYPGLEGQEVGIMVWADRGILIDWETLPLDLSNAIQNKLTESKAKEMKGVTWPYPAASYVRYMRDHPGAEAYPITELAPKLGVARLIYVEVQRFRTRSRTELELFRGEATASLRVLETFPDGTSQVGYSEDDISAVFPKNVPTDGRPNLGDERTYYGAVDMLAEQIVLRMITHENLP